MIRTLAVVVALTVVATACGSDSPFPESAPAVPVDNSTFPVEVAGARIVARPVRIVSLSTVSTEVLFAVGAGDQVIAVDSQSTHPPGAPVTDLSSFEPNVEAIVAFEPDLVFTSFDPGDLVAGLETLGIPTILHAGAADLDEAYSQIEQVGVATGHVGEAAALVAGMRSDLAALAADLPDPVDARHLLPRDRQHLLHGHLHVVHR